MEERGVDPFDCDSNEELCMNGAYKCLNQDVDETERRFIKDVIYGEFEELDEYNPSQSIIQSYGVCPLGLASHEAGIIHEMVGLFISKKCLPYPGSVQDQPYWFWQAYGIVQEIQYVLELRQRIKARQERQVTDKRHMLERR